MNRIRRYRTHTVFIQEKRFVTESMVVARVKELGSNIEFQVKFNNREHAETVMYDLQDNTLLIIDGFMGHFAGVPEFTITSFEVKNRSMKSFLPSDQVEYLNFTAKKKASN
jgi:hypothetical protein